MFSLFVASTFSKPPIVLLPGLYGSALTAKYDKGFAEHWYCPKSLDNDLFWVNYRYVIPPTYNCLFEMLRAYYDPQTKKVVSPPGLTIDVPDFGGEEGLSYVDQQGIAGLHFIESLSPMLDYLKGKGYVVKGDLYGAPYDWRLAMAGLEEPFFPKLKNLIETAAKNNNGQKVTVLGYSCGGFCIQRFFSSYVSKEWKSQYIAKAIFLAPAFAGSPMTLDVAWNRYFPILPILKNDIIEETIERVPCVHSLFPNVKVYGDKPLIIGPNGEKITAPQIPDFLVQQGKFHEHNIALMRENTKIIYNTPANPDVPLMMLYNSKISTAMTMNFVKGYGEKPEVITEGGDGTVPALGPKWGCENWKGDKALVCYDVENADDGFNHGGMSTNAFVHDIIYKYLTTDDWVKTKGARYVYAPDVKMFKNNTEYKLTGLRSESIEWIKH